VLRLALNLSRYMHEEEEVSCIGRRPSAPSPPSGLSLVPFEDVTPSPNEWLNSPLRPGSKRVEVLSLIGDLLDNGLIKDQDAVEGIKFVMESLENVSAFSDLLEARKDLFGKARFVKLFLAGRVTTSCDPPVTTPPFTSTPIVPATVFDCSSVDERVSPVPLVYPKAIRIATVPILGTAVWPYIRAATTEPKESPESAKSTNPGSSIEVSPPNNTLSLTRETTACSNTSPQTGWKPFGKKCPVDHDSDVVTCSSN
jgi:hypothetical protein